jgi:hypothetical protein
LRGVKDTKHTGPKGTGLLIYTVDQTKISKQLRELKPWEYLKASGDEKLAADSQAALQSVFHTGSVLRAQRIHATISMKLGRVVWRRILYNMKNEVKQLLLIHRWYLVPFYYLKHKYLRYCIREIEHARDLIFKRFGFSYADLRKDSDLLKPKASFLRAFRTKEILFESDSLSMTEEYENSLREFSRTYEPPEEVRVNRQRRRRRR